MSQNTGQSNNSKFLAYSGWALAVLGLAWSVALYISDAKGSRLSWSSENLYSLTAPYDQIMSEPLAEKAMGDPVQVHKLDVWNSGNRPITPKDNAEIVVTSTSGKIIELYTNKANFVGSVPNAVCANGKCIVPITELDIDHGVRFIAVTLSSSPNGILLTGRIPGNDFQRVTAQFGTQEKGEWVWGRLLIYLAALGVFAVKMTSQMIDIWKTAKQPDLSLEKKIREFAWLAFGAFMVLGFSLYILTSVYGWVFVPKSPLN